MAVTSILSSKRTHMGWLCLLIRVHVRSLNPGTPVATSPTITLAAYILFMCPVILRREILRDMSSSESPTRSGALDCSAAHFVGAEVIGNWRYRSPPGASLRGTPEVNPLRQALIHVVAVASSASEHPRDSGKMLTHPARLSRGHSANRHSIP